MVAYSIRDCAAAVGKAVISYWSGRLYWSHPIMGMKFLPQYLILKVGAYAHSETTPGTRTNSPGSRTNSSENCFRSLL